jgi:hypothetical protein
MRIRFACLVLGVMLVPGAAHADSHFADFYGGGSGGGGGSKLGGFIVAFGKGQTQPVDPKLPLKKVLFGGVGGASVQFGSHEDGRSVTQVVWSAGPRFTFEKNRDSRNFYHAQVTLGSVYSNDGNATKDFTTVVGAAWDHVFGARPGGITPHPGLGMRLQADRVFNLGNEDREDIWRLSAGFIYRVPKL